jgi:ATP-dependent Clp protease ATP-binding subunit ClpC
VVPLPIAVELSQVYDEARDIADQVGQPLTTAHVLLALFTLPNPTEVFLGDRRISEDSILAVIREGEKEPPSAVRELKEKTEQLAHSLRSSDVNSMHLWVALCNARGSTAHRLLLRSGEDVTTLRNTAMGFLSGRMPRKYLNFRQTSARARERVLSPAVPLKTVATAAASPAGLRMPAVRAEAREGVPVLPHVKAAPPKTASPGVTGSLAPEEYPLLTSLGRNLTVLAREGRVDTLVGRHVEVERIIDILGKKRSNNPCLVGDPGVGKTAIAEGLARRLVQDSEGVTGLTDLILVELDVGSLVAGTQLRGSFSERLLGLKEELRKANGKVVVFIDEIHTLIGAGSSGEGPLDAANELKAALSRGEFPCIGATTPGEYKKYIERDAALARRFVLVPVHEPEPDEALRIVQGAAVSLGQHHGVTYQPAALHAAVALASRFVQERCLPGKALDVVDLAGSRARRHGRTQVDRADVARVISEVAEVPLDRLLEEDQVRFLGMEPFIASRVIGHRAIIKAVCESIRRAYAGFAGRRPMASFLFLGPTGVGKTELVKVLADFLFGSREALIRLDMSEYAEAHAVSRLLGSPPGYVGHDNGGQLTEAVRRRPYAMVLLDEVEKAHPEVLLPLLQVLDEGRLTDAKGRTVSFRNTVIVMTSNHGGDRFAAASHRLGFASPDAEVRAGAVAQKEVLDVARKAMPPELWGRIDERVVFAPLRREDVTMIAAQLLSESSVKLNEERNISYTAGEDVVEFLMERGGYDSQMGARPMRQAIQRFVESAVADAILAGRYRSGDRVVVRVEHGALRVGRVGSMLPQEVAAVNVRLRSDGGGG